MGGVVRRREGCTCRALWGCLTHLASECGVGMGAVGEWEGCGGLGGGVSGGKEWRQDAQAVLLLPMRSASGSCPERSASLYAVYCTGFFVLLKLALLEALLVPRYW